MTTKGAAYKDIEIPTRHEVELFDEGRLSEIRQWIAKARGEAPYAFADLKPCIAATHLQWLLERLANYRGQIATRRLDGALAEIAKLRKELKRLWRIEASPVRMV